MVLLTEGVPSGITLYATTPPNSNGNNIVSGSASGGSCTYKTITAPGNSSNMMQNWFAIPGPPYSTSSGNPYGMYLLASTDPTVAHTSNWWMQNGGADADFPNPQTPYAGCTSMMNNGGSTTYNYFSKIPATDAYGNSLTTGGYTNSHVTGGGALPTIYNGTPLDLTQYNIDYHWGLAMWNSVDNAPKSIPLDSNKPNRTGDTRGDKNNSHNTKRRPRNGRQV